jgi:hypothetical protein
MFFLKAVNMVAHMLGKEVKIRRITVQDQNSEKVSETPPISINNPGLVVCACEPSHTEGHR